MSLFTRIYSCITFRPSVPLDVTFNRFIIIYRACEVNDLITRTNHAATIIQGAWRQHMRYVKIKSVIPVITSLQSRARRFLAQRRHYDMLEMSRHNNYFIIHLSSIQSLCRRRLAILRVTELREERSLKTSIVVHIQQRARCLLARRKLLKYRNSAPLSLFDKLASGSLPHQLPDPVGKVDDVRPSNILQVLQQVGHQDFVPSVATPRDYVLPATRDYTPAQQAIYNAKPLLMLYKQPLVVLNNSLRVMAEFFDEFSAVPFRPSKPDELYIKHYKEVYSITDACVSDFRKHSKLETDDLFHQAIHALPPIMFNFSDFKREALFKKGFLVPSSIKRALYTIQVRYLDTGPEYLLIEFNGIWTGFPILSFIHYCNLESKRIVNRRYFNNFAPIIKAPIIPLSFDLLPKDCLYGATLLEDQQTDSPSTIGSSIGRDVQSVKITTSEVVMPPPVGTEPPLIDLSEEIVVDHTKGPYHQQAPSLEAIDVVSNDPWTPLSTIPTQEEIWGYANHPSVSWDHDDGVWLDSGSSGHIGKVVDFDEDGKVHCKNPDCHIELLGASRQKSVWREGLCGDCHGTIAQEKNTLRQRAQNNGDKSSSSRQERCRCWGNQRGICIKHGHKIYLLNGKCQNCV
jgi:hypothetical protein